MTLSEKVAYLKGVAEGLKFDPDKTTEGKLISIMMDILEHLSLNTEEDDDSIQGTGRPAGRRVRQPGHAGGLCLQAKSSSISRTSTTTRKTTPRRPCRLSRRTASLSFGMSQLRRHAGRGQERVGFLPCCLPGCGQESEIELGYEDAEDDSDEE